MTLTIPGHLDAALSFLGMSNFPEGDEDALHAMAQSYRSVSNLLSTASDDVSRGADQLGDVIEGIVHDAMHSYFTEIAGSPNGLEQVAKDYATSGDLARATAEYVLMCKELYIIQLEIFAAVLTVCIISAFETFGASMAVAAAEGVATRVALQTLVKQLTTQILERVMATTAKEIGVHALKGAAIGAAMDGGKAGVGSLLQQLVGKNYFGGPVDLGKVGGEALQKGAAGAVGGAVAGAGKKVVDGPAPFGPQPASPTVRDRLQGVFTDRADTTDAYRRYVDGSMTDAERRAYQDKVLADKGPELAGKSGATAAEKGYEKLAGKGPGQPEVPPSLAGPSVSSSSVERLVVGSTPVEPRSAPSSSRGTESSGQDFVAQPPQGAARDPGFSAQLPGDDGWTPNDGQPFRYEPLSGVSSETGSSLSPDGSAQFLPSAALSEGVAQPSVESVDEPKGRRGLNLDTT
ncbi:hypothetical protein ACQ7HM_14260 [Williamsia sp. MIQD14]|uniref:WXG100-like domain-containing protein n=1 Tax=Williamsia sp. MIQD14 TaxID=3425703 RepID=UPI003DA16827